MELEAVRSVADWLAGTTTDSASADQGVNTHLALVQRDAGDSQPANATVYDTTRDEIPAVNRQPGTLPAVIVAPGPRSRMDGEVATRYRRAEDVQVLVSYMASDADAAAAIEAGLYTMRAVRRSLREFNRNANSPARTRNGIVLEACNYMETVDVFAETEGAIITAGLLVGFQASDDDP